MKNKIIWIFIVVALVAIISFDFYAKGEERVRIPTSADNAPPGSIHNLPLPEAVAKVKTLVAEEFETEEGLVIIQSALEKDWPNSCLGLEGREELCAQVITPGYEIVLDVEGERVTYRTNLDGSLIREDTSN